MSKDQDFPNTCYPTYKIKYLILYVGQKVFGTTIFDAVLYTSLMKENILNSPEVNITGNGI